MKINCFIKVAVVCFTFFDSSPSIVAAQDLQSVEELQGLVETQQIMLEKQQEKLEVQQKQLNKQAEFMQQLQNQLDLLKADKEGKETTELAETLTEKPAEKSHNKC